MSATDADDAIVLHGIDFSGGANPAGKIWVATRDAERTTLRRGFDHRAIVDLILASLSDGRRHLWRIDAPFGLAIETLAAHGLPNGSGAEGRFGAPWPAMARWMAEQGSARGWRGACRSVSRREPRRVADDAARTPMAPTNLRIFKQTWAAITQVLAPLVERGVVVAPFVPVGGGGVHSAAVVVAEGCPASAMHLRGWPVRGYKGAGDPPAERRREIVAALRASGVPIPADAARRAIDDVEGDGVDALVLVLDPAPTVVPWQAPIEGWVYM
ncbi:MAG TPA: DUF429 domain-containing protein [Phycisphaerales bacterium]|nr:DUF429 domain-containing protein [Phycisphaerales bacterium]HMP37994.1 DUF429 domain-containing protein [Phycisphaerales bacterium]